MLLCGAPAQRPAPAPDIRWPRQLLSATRVQVANFGRKFKHETIDNIPDLLPALILLGITAGCGPTTFPCSSIRSALRCSSSGSPDVRFRTFPLGVYRYTKYHNDKNRAAELF
jgi:hypothetical protein